MWRRAVPGNRFCGLLAGDRLLARSTLNYPVSFFDDKFLIGGLAREGVHLTGWPSHLDRVDPGGGAQSEVGSGIACRFEAAVGSDKHGLRGAAGSDLDAGSVAVAVRGLAHRLDAQPVPG